jgi:hypothetical protein
VLLVEKHRQMAEIQVKSRTAVLSGAEETGDSSPPSPRWWTRSSARPSSRRRRSPAAAAARGRAASDAAAAIASEVEVLEDDGARLGPMRIIPSERYRLKPLSRKTRSWSWRDGGTSCVTATARLPR